MLPKLGSPDAAVAVPQSQWLLRKNTTENHFEYLLFNYLCREVKSREKREEEGTEKWKLTCLSGNWGISICNVCAPFLTPSITLRGALMAPALFSPPHQAFLSVAMGKTSQNLQPWAQISPPQHWSLLPRHFSLK